jgi:serine protease inhibitor
MIENPIPPAGSDPVNEFRADIIFIFLIPVNGTGSILFLGRFMNPAASE